MGRRHCCARKCNKLYNPNDGEGRRPIDPETGRPQKYQLDFVGTVDFVFPEGEYGSGSSAAISFISSSTEYGPWNWIVHPDPNIRQHHRQYYNSVLRRWTYTVYYQQDWWEVDAPEPRLDPRSPSTYGPAFPNQVVVLSNNPTPVGSIYASSGYRQADESDVEFSTIDWSFKYTPPPYRAYLEHGTSSIAWLDPRRWGYTWFEPGNEVKEGIWQGPEEEAVEQWQHHMHPGSYRTDYLITIHGMPVYENMLPPVSSAAAAYSLVRGGISEWVWYSDFGGYNSGYVAGQISDASAQDIVESLWVPNVYWAPRPGFHGGFRGVSIPESQRGPVYATPQHVIDNQIFGIMDDGTPLGPGDRVHNSVYSTYHPELIQIGQFLATVPVYDAGGNQIGERHAYPSEIFNGTAGVRVVHRKESRNFGNPSFPYAPLENSLSMRLIGGPPCRSHKVIERNILRHDLMKTGGEGYAITHTNWQTTEKISFGSSTPEPVINVSWDKLWWSCPTLFTQFEEVSVPTGREGTGPETSVMVVYSDAGKGPLSLTGGSHRYCYTDFDDWEPGDYGSAAGFVPAAWQALGQTVSRWNGYHVTPSDRPYMGWAHGLDSGYLDTIGAGSILSLPDGEMSGHEIHLKELYSFKDGVASLNFKDFRDRLNFAVPWYSYVRGPLSTMSVENSFQGTLSGSHGSVTTQLGHGGLARIPSGTMVRLGGGTSADRIVEHPAAGYVGGATTIRPWWASRPHGLEYEEGVFDEHLASALGMHIDDTAAHIMMVRVRNALVGQQISTGTHATGSVIVTDSHYDFIRSNIESWMPLVGNLPGIDKHGPFQFGRDLGGNSRQSLFLSARVNYYSVYRGKKRWTTPTRRADKLGENMEPFQPARFSHEIPTSVVPDPHMEGSGILWSNAKETDDGIMPDTLSLGGTPDGEFTFPLDNNESGKLPSGVTPAVTADIEVTRTTEGEGWNPITEWLLPTWGRGKLPVGTAGSRTGPFGQQFVARGLEINPIGPDENPLESYRDVEGRLPGTLGYLGPPEFAQLLGHTPLLGEDEY